MTYSTATPRIACYLLLKQNGKYAFVLRANTGWRDGYYGLPAGKVEKNESYIQGAIREAQEEVGVTLQATNLKHVLTSHRFEDGSDWVDVVFEADKWEGEVVNNEPHMHGELAWFGLDNLPENINPSLGLMLEQIADGNNFFEYGWEE
ncbi:NUDIX domain-containing protein [Polaromonas sp.]|nr:NUDIX domain-containing protein [Candidatus Saccharibacteria bacterium]